MEAGGGRGGRNEMMGIGASNQRSPQTTDEIVVLTSSSFVSQSCL